MGQAQPGQEGPIGKKGERGAPGKEGPPGDTGQQGNIGNALSVVNYDQVISILLKDDRSLTNLSNYLLQNQTTKFLTDIGNKISTETVYLNKFNPAIINNNTLVENIQTLLRNQEPYISQLQGDPSDSVMINLNTLGNIILNNPTYAKQLSDAIVNSGAQFTNSIIKNVITNKINAELSNTFATPYFAIKVRAEIDNTPVLKNTTRGAQGATYPLNKNTDYNVLKKNLAPYTVWCGEGSCVTPENVNNITIRGNGQSFISQDTNNNLIINTDDNMYLDSNVNTSNNININSNGSNPFIIKGQNGLRFSNWDVNYMNPGSASNKLSFWNNGNIATQISDGNGNVYVRGGISIGGGDEWGIFSPDDNNVDIWYNGEKKITFNKRGDVSLPRLILKDRDRDLKLGTWYIRTPQYDTSRLIIGNEPWGIVAFMNSDWYDRFRIYGRGGQDSDNTYVAFNLNSNDWRTTAPGSNINDNYTDADHRWNCNDNCTRNSDGMYRLLNGQKYV